MSLSVLNAISPIDGRYRSKVTELESFFSEQALIKYRILIEIEYFIALCEAKIDQLSTFDEKLFVELRLIYDNFSTEDAIQIKNIENTTNHDVKAVEYFIKEKFDSLGISEYKEFIHFGLTSQDINNTAIPLSVKIANEKVYIPFVEELINKLEQLSNDWSNIPMLARTHGQPASPTRLGKEINVFKVRLEEQLKVLNKIPNAAKFGGATGNFNAHHLASLFDAMKRINSIMIDLNRDFWTYISMDYFKQKIKKGEVGSSAMPHKVNPIDFENSEGNLGIANAVFQHLASKLPVSRLQRDLTDSTVLRNIGVPYAHTIIAFKSTIKGLNKLLINKNKIASDLEQNWAVVAEAIQTILRREGYPNPYEALKGLTRTNSVINSNSISEFINNLDISDKVKEELKKITPSNYTGI